MSKIILSEKFYDLKFYAKKNKHKYKIINSNLNIEYNKKEIIKSIDRLL